MLKLWLLLILGFLWAARLVAIKSAGLSGVPIHVTMSMAFFGVAAFFVVVALWRRSWPPVNTATVRFYLVTGALGFVTPFILENLVAPQISVFVFVVIISTMPIVTLILAFVFRVERPDLVQSAAVALGFCVALLVAWDTTRLGDAGGASWLWVAIAFGVPALYALNTLYVASHWPSGADAMHVAHAQGLIVSVAAVAGSVAVGATDEWPLVVRNAPAVAAIALTEGMALLLYLRVTRQHGAIFVSLANYVAIVFAAVLGAALHGDRLTWISVGAALVLVAALTLHRRGRHLSRSVKPSHN